MIMENTPVNELIINAGARSNLQTSGQWAMFISIVGVVFVGLLVVFGFSFGSIMKAIGGEAAVPGFPSFLFGIIYLVIGVIYFFPLLYLYRFSSFTKKGVSNMDQVSMDLAFSNLKSHLTFIGVMMAIVMGLYVMGGVIFALVAIVA